MQSQGKNEHGDWIVRNHAVIRWIERVMGVDLTLHREAVREVYGERDDSALMRLLENDGFDLDGIRATILSDTVRDALAAGMSVIPVGGHFVLYCRDGRIVTVLDLTRHSVAFARVRRSKALRAASEKNLRGRSRRRLGKELKARQERRGAKHRDRIFEEAM